MLLTNNQVRVVIEKLRQTAAQATPDQLSVSPYITVKQARAVVEWFDRLEQLEAASAVAAQFANRTTGMVER